MLSHLFYYVVWFWLHLFWIQNSIWKWLWKQQNVERKKPLLSSLLARGRNPARPGRSLRPITFPSPLFRWPSVGLLPPFFCFGRGAGFLRAWAGPAEAVAGAPSLLSGSLTSGVHMSVRLHPLVANEPGLSSPIRTWIQPGTKGFLSLSSTNSSYKRRCLPICCLFPSLSCYGFAPSPRDAA
jgi:hypothetical protein